MAQPIAYAVNRLETSLVTVPGAALDRPGERLFDRLTGPLWEDTASGTRIIPWDQGASPLATDGVVGAAGHNLGGLTLTVQSDDNAGFASPTTLGSVVPAGTAAWRITGTASAERYWRLTIASAVAPPRLGELLASQGFLFPFGPSDANLHRGRRGKGTKHESEAGVVLGYRRGATRWIWTATIPHFTLAYKTQFETLFEDLDGGFKPFFFVDEDGSLRWVEWVDPELVIDAEPLRESVTITLREALG